jgi:hypothetical protein
VAQTIDLDMTTPATRHSEVAHQTTGRRDDAPEAPGVDLYWLPLGAGGRFVRFNGRCYEHLVARRDRRAPLDLYHSALEVRTDGRRHTIEMSWPIPPDDGHDRGVVAQGHVGTHRLGRYRAFCYEVRCWLDGSIPDVGWAVASPQRVTVEEPLAQRVLALTGAVPTEIWGRDELRLGEMWNSNSIVSWLLERAGVPTDEIEPPPGGRAPGWEAGRALARLAPSGGHSPTRRDR